MGDGILSRRLSQSPPIRPEDVAEMARAMLGEKPDPDRRDWTLLHLAASTPEGSG